MNNEILEHFIAELSQSSVHCQSVRGFYAKKFLEFAGDRPYSDWNKNLVSAFVERLGREGYAQGTIRYIYGVVKRVYDSAKAVHEAQRIKLISEINPDDRGAVASVLQAMTLPGPSWDVGKRSAPKVEEEVKPAVPIAELEAMIEALKGTAGPEAAYLALSSIYGLRRGELCSVRQEHLDFGEKTIFVLTEKGGEKRKQLLCDEIIPVLKDYGFKWEYSDFQMSSLYRRICAKAGIEPVDGSGWHSVRRLLDTELVNIFGQLRAHIFLRWKISSSSRMTERYFSEDPLAVDKHVICNGHPVIPLWRVGGGNESGSQRGKVA